MVIVRVPFTPSVFGGWYFENSTVSKSVVSKRFVYGTERKLAELTSRELRGLHC
jgi:hypothetical protein